MSFPECAPAIAVKLAAMRASVIAAAALATFLAACAGPGSLVGRPAAELQGALGTQIGEYPNADGSRTLAFSYGYYSGQTYLAEVDRTGTVRNVRQALVEESFQRVEPGMTRDEVLRLIGPPLESMDFTRQREVSWEYRFVDAWGYRAFFYVNFDPRGLVVSKLTRRVENERFPLR
jgi:outer membrane protein assembly factor BamE (lipoprotein component of BamABCDE complex)